MENNTKEFEQFYTKAYNEYYGKILNHVSIRIKNREEAEDLTQEIFLKAYKYLSLYDATKGQFSTWIYSLAKNQLVDYFRIKKLEIADMAMYTSDDDESGNVHSDYHFIDNDNPEKQFIRKETHANVQKAMSKLPANIRRTTIEFFNGDLTLKETGELVGTCLNTTKNTIHRGRKILQRQLVHEHQTA